MGEVEYECSFNVQKTPEVSYLVLGKAEIGILMIITPQQYFSPLPEYIYIYVFFYVVLYVNCTKYGLVQQI